MLIYVGGMPAQEPSFSRCLGGRMATTPDFEGRGFDPEAVAVLGAAFDAAWQSVQKDLPYLASGPLALRTRNALAKSIIDAAITGERDLQKLVNGALAGLRP